LVIDIKNSSLGLNNTLKGFISSKSVGSVSESYQFPQWVLSNPLYSVLAKTGYGEKYISLVQNQMIGNFGVVAGRTLA
jgi:subtilase family serine protease